MRNKHLIWAAPIAFTVALSGCATEQPYYGSAPQSQPQQPYYGSNPQYYPQQAQYPQAQTGTVDRIEVINRGGGSNVAGTVIGGIIGGLIGTQIGRGTGRTAATVAGAVGGAAAGNAIEGRQRAANETFRVTVRLDNGAVQTITQDNISDLRTGDRVRLDGSAIVRI